MDESRVAAVIVRRGCAASDATYFEISPLMVYEWEEEPIRRE